MGKVQVVCFVLDFFFYCLYIIYNWFIFIIYQFLILFLLNKRSGMSVGAAVVVLLGLQLTLGMLEGSQAAIVGMVPVPPVKKTKKK